MNAQSAPISFTGGASVTARLSARQLSEVELGLFLLSQLTPLAPPTALPALLRAPDPSDTDCPVWTAKQHKYLSRARYVLARFRESSLWDRLVERYVTLPNHLTAFDVSRDRSRFCTKTVGFTRNRTATFRQMLA
ncbi:MAG: hypothetical protein EAZ91_12930 [Cytophagales bacterium]|nr:MAG: hypothetical protein EAZ91_12930 [Cytophagales bacterium]